MERFEVYLDEVDRDMTGRVDALKREELIAELRSHLSLSLRAGLDEMGMEPLEAERAALRGLGAPRLVAEDLVRQVTGRSSKSAWRLARVPAGLDLAAYLILPVVLACLPYTYRHPSILSMSGWVAIGSLIAFTLAVRRSRRWLLAPMAASAIGGLVLFFSIYFTAPFQNLQQGAMVAADMAPDLQVSLARVNADLRLAEGGAASLRSNPELFRRDGGYVAPTWAEVGQGYELPYLPVTVQLGSRKDITLRPMADREQAIAAWDASGEFIGADLVKEKEALLRLRVGAANWGMLIYLVAFPLARLFVLGMVNWGILALSGRRRRTERDRFVRL